MVGDDSQRPQYLKVIGPFLFEMGIRVQAARNKLMKTNKKNLKALKKLAENMILGINLYPNAGYTFMIS